MTRRRLHLIAGLFLMAAPFLHAQYGGNPGDVVFYAVTANGSGDFQSVLPTTTTNSAQNLANFKVTSLDSVPFVTSDPFPLLRQVFYMTDSETFQVGTDTENTVGLHRIFIYPTKILVIQGVNWPFGVQLGNVSNFVTFPVGLDVTSDIALETLKVITWFPGPWPFIVLTDHRGDVGPPDIPGFAYEFQIPNAVKLPALIPWVNMSALYPGAGWQEGIDFKLLEMDASLGDTIRLVRLRPGKQTPLFRIPGHTHLFVLQGSATITPAGAGPLPMNQYDYAFLPEGFAVTLSNPAPYSGSGSP